SLYGGPQPGCEHVPEARSARVRAAGTHGRQPQRQGAGGGLFPAPWRPGLATYRRLGRAAARAPIPDRAAAGRPRGAGVPAAPLERRGAVRPAGARAGADGDRSARRRPGAGRLVSGLGLASVHPVDRPGRYRARIPRAAAVPARAEPGPLPVVPHGRLVRRGPRAAAAAGAARAHCARAWPRPGSQARGANRPPGWVSALLRPAGRLRGHDRRLDGAAPAAADHLLCRPLDGPGDRRTRRARGVGAARGLPGGVPVRLVLRLAYQHAGQLQPAARARWLLPPGGPYREPDAAGPSADVCARAAVDPASATPAAQRCGAVLRLVRSRHPRLLWALAVPRTQLLVALAAAGPAWGVAERPATGAPRGAAGRPGHRHPTGTR